MLVGYLIYPFMFLRVCSFRLALSEPPGVMCAWAHAAQKRQNPLQVHDSRLSTRTQGKGDQKANFGRD